MHLNREPIPNAQKKAIIPLDFHTHLLLVLLGILSPSRLITRMTGVRCQQLECQHCDRALCRWITLKLHPPTAPKRVEASTGL